MMPGWDDNPDLGYIAYRVRDPGGFQKDSFRTVELKKDKPRVVSIMGRLKGQTTMTLQSVRFPRDDGWILSKAKKWLEDHPNIKERKADMNDIARRDLSIENIEIREVDDDKREILMKIPYNHLSKEISDFRHGRFKEKIRSGFFNSSIKRGKVKALWNHNEAMVLGSMLNDTLRFEDGPKELTVIATPPNTTWARDALESIRGGYIEGASFGFNARSIKDEWDYKANPPIRELIDGEVFEFSTCSVPAYESGIEARSLLADAGIDIERIAELLEAQKRGLELNPDDRTVIDGAIGALQELISDSSDQVVVDDPQDESRTRFEMLKRKQEIVEIEMLEETNEIKGVKTEKA